MKTSEILEYVSTAGIMLVFILTASCGNFQRPEPAPGIDPELVEYVERFEEIAAEYHGEGYRIPKMNIDIGDTDGVFPTRPGDITLGWCKHGSRDKPPRIMINEEEWQYMRDAKRELLMFHELGHCALGRYHRNTATPLNIPVSIMTTYIMDSDTYIQNKEYYMDELFMYNDLSFVEKITSPVNNECGRHNHE